MNIMNLNAKTIIASFVAIVELIVIITGGNNSTTIVETVQPSSYSSPYIQNEPNQIEEPESEGPELEGPELEGPESEEPVNKPELEEPIEIKDLEQILVKSLENFEDSTILTIRNYSSSKAKPIVSQIDKRHPLIDYSYKNTQCEIIEVIDWEKDIVEVKFSFEYQFSKEEMIRMKKEAEEKAVEIVNEVIKPSMTLIEKEKALHDYLVINATFDNNYSSNPESFTDYGILIKKTGVCEGYSKAFMRLLNLCNIENKYIRGQAFGGNHAWTLVKLESGWTHVDTMFNSTNYHDKVNNRDYFNMNDIEISIDHEWKKNDYPECN